MPSKKNPEIEALEAVYGALKDLPSDIRMKVLKGVFALLGIEGMQAEDYIQQKQARPTYEQSINDEAGTSILEPTESAPPSLGGRQKSLMELILEKNPSTNIERIALFAYYREKYEGKSRFGRDDLQPYFAKARVVPPKNFNRDFNETVKKGWVHEDGSESYVTSRGIEAVESGFASEKPGKSTRPKPRPTDKKSPANSKKQSKKGRSK